MHLIDCAEGGSGQAAERRRAFHLTNEAHDGSRAASRPRQVAARTETRWISRHRDEIRRSRHPVLNGRQDLQPGVPRHLQQSEETVAVMVADN